MRIKSLGIAWGWQMPGGGGLGLGAAVILLTDAL